MLSSLLKIQVRAVDLLLGAVILLLAAATIIPQWLRPERDTREIALLLDLHMLRSRIAMHQVQYPQTAGTTADDVQQIFDLWPENPYNGGRGVLIVPDVDAAAPNESARRRDQLVGWIYSPAQRRIKANASGTAADGTPLQRL